MNGRIRGAQPLENSDKHKKYRGLRGVLCGLNPICNFFFSKNRRNMDFPTSYRHQKHSLDYYHYSRHPLTGFINPSLISIKLYLVFILIFTVLTIIYEYIWNLTKYFR